MRDSRSRLRGTALLLSPDPRRLPAASLGRPLKRLRVLAAAELLAHARDRDGETEAAAEDARDEHADDVALPVDRRAAGVAGVRGGVGLDSASA